MLAARVLTAIEHPQDVIAISARPCGQRAVLKFAARVLTAIENPQDVIAISARPYGQRAVLKFAQYTGAASIAGRFTPGTFTNQITKQFREPRILIITDPRTDSQAVAEA